MQVKWKSSGSFQMEASMQVQWKSIKGKLPYVPAVTSIYARRSFRPLLYASKHDSHLRPPTSIPSDEFPVLPFDICFYGNLLSTSAETSIHSHVLQYTPFKLLPPTFIPFKKKSSTFIGLLFLRKLHLRLQKLPFTLIRRLSTVG